MNLLQSGKKITLVVRNVGRLKEVVSTLARYGFQDLLVRMRLERYLPGKMKIWLLDQAEIPTEMRVRKAFEELGPTFIKFGQLLATRSDLFSEPVITELSKLQDQAPRLDFSVIKHILKNELGETGLAQFSKITEAPIAAASIAQVHGAVLITGEKVVIKVQRPDIDRIIRQDIQLLETLAELLERYVPEARMLSPKVLVEEFFRTLEQELDFKIEANNLNRLSENLQVFPEIRIPKLYEKLSTHRVLVQERFFGIPFNDLERIRASGQDLRRLNQIGARAFFKSVFVDGIFHGDLHGGNLFLLENGQLGLIDFGIVGRISKRAKEQLSNMVQALVTEDFELLCMQYAELGSAGPSVDFDGFQREVRSALAPYLGLKAKDINNGRVLIQATRIATRYQISIPGEWMVLFRAIFSLEGMGRALDPDFDALALGRELAKDYFKDKIDFAKLSQEWVWFGQEWIQLAQQLPRQFRWALKKWAKDGYAIELKIPEIDAYREDYLVQQKKSNAALLAGALLVASAIAFHSGLSANWLGFPVVPSAGLVIAILFYLKSR